MRWLIRRILKLDSGITVFGWLYDRISNNWIALVALFGGVGMSYLAKITQWINPWGPVGWGAVGIVTTSFLLIVISITLYVVALVRMTNVNRKFTEKTITNSSTNTFNDSFKHDIIKLSDFYHPYGRVMKQKNFTDCELYGPALFLTSACILQDPYLEDCDMVIINEPMKSECATLFERCSFVRCAFFKVTFFISKEQARDMAKVISLNIVSGRI